MHRKQLLTQLEEYRSSRFMRAEEQETLKRIINFINDHTSCFDRATTGHITSSIWIVNAQRTHALLTHHKKFNIWVQLGGHNDSEVDCKRVALQEAHEESGIAGFTFLHEGIFDIDIHPIPGACAYHYDIRYLLQAPADACYIVSEESHDLAWVAFDDMKKYSDHSSVLRMHEKFLQFASKIKT